MPVAQQEHPLSATERAQRYHEAREYLGLASNELVRDHMERVFFAALDRIQRNSTAHIRCIRTDSGKRMEVS